MFFLDPTAPFKHFNQSDNPSKYAVTLLGLDRCQCASAAPERKPLGFLLLIRTFFFCNTYSALQTSPDFCEGLSRRECSRVCVGCLYPSLRTIIRDGSPHRCLPFNHRRIPGAVSQSGSRQPLATVITPTLAEFGMQNAHTKYKTQSKNSYNSAL